MATAPDDRHLLRRKWLALLAAIAIALAVAVSGWLLMRHPAATDGLLQINGRIEGDRVTLAPKLAGRVIELAVREGDTVSAGQLLVRLDDRAMRARLDQALAAQETLQAQIVSQEAGLDVLRGETAVAVKAASTRIAAAEADVRRAEAARAQDKRDHARAEDLSRKASSARRLWSARAPTASRSVARTSRCSGRRC
jgi:HlyD family secretion protein